MRTWTRIERFFKKRCLKLLEGVCGKRELSPSEVDLESIRRILIIRQHDQLGDLLVSSPAFRALRERFPKAHISLLVREYTAEAVLNNQYLDEIIVYYKVGYNWTLRRILQFLKKLRAGYDLTVVLNTVSHSFTSDLLAHLSGARYVLGSEHQVFPGCHRNFFYNLIAPYWKGPRHQTERNLDILRYLGIDTTDKREVLTLTAEETDWARKYLNDLGMNSKEAAVGIHPGAGKRENRWDVGNFVQVAHHLHYKHGAEILVMWGPKEEEIGQRMLRELTFKPIVVKGLNLRELAAVISQLDLLLCNDTGVMHLAAAVGTPLVAIFGPTDPGDWKPIGEGFVALRGEDKRCDSVGVEDVIREVDKLLKRGGKNGLQ